MKKSDNEIAIFALKPSEKIIKYYLNHHSNVVVVTPNFVNIKGIKVVLDKELLTDEEIDHIKNTKRPNWYKQQLLKLKYLLSAECKYVHIIDGDSIVNPNILFSEVLYYTEKSLPENYLKYASQLNLQITNRNYVTNQMNFNTEWVRNLWKERLINVENICRIESPSCDLSEYALYAAYIRNRYFVNDMHIKVFRRMESVWSFIRSDERDSKYAIYSYEVLHKTSLIRRLFYNIAYLMGKNLG